MKKYILITPAYNEEKYIEKTILSVISQTFLPQVWVIVSDGSTDGTDAIVKKYASEYKWIDFLRMPEHSDRQFAAKVKCFYAGYEKVKGIDYDIIGNLDADISFENDYFEFLISKFEENSKLGVAGTPFVENGKHYDYRFTNIEHVSGACQLFRRACFEQIGGFLPIKEGGEDWVAVTTARMYGWKTRTFTDKTCIHHRKIGSGSNSFMAWIKQGRRDYSLGYHPLWEVFRILYQMGKPPYIIRGLCLSVGYLWPNLMRKRRPISKELMWFNRREQIQRLKNFVHFNYSFRG